MRSSRGSGLASEGGGGRLPLKPVPPGGGKVIGDRWLGDEWTDWTGETDACSVKTGKGVFLACAGLGMGLFLGGALFLLFMVEPRLSALPGPLYLAARIIFWALFCTVTLWFASVVLSSLAERKIGLPIFRYNKGVSLLFSLASAVGRRAGVSRDRLGGSFIQVCNALIKAGGPRHPCGKLLILTPRCLTRRLKQRMQTLAQEYGCEIFTAGGGEVARRRIIDSKPGAVIGIACERDLVNGIRDVFPLMPVLAIPNVRPLGPCKDTQVDIGKVEEAVKFFMSPA
jgi:hypothetical protein